MTAQAARSQAENEVRVTSDNGHTAYQSNPNGHPADLNGKSSSL